MDIFGILEPDPHENLCGSETLVTTLQIITFCTNTIYSIVYSNRVASKNTVSFHYILNQRMGKRKKFLFAT